MYLLLKCDFLAGLLVPGLIAEGRKSLPEPMLSIAVCLSPKITIRCSEM